MDFPVGRTSIPASRPLRAVIHGMALAFLDLLAGMGALSLQGLAARELPPLVIQIPAALALTVLGFAAWCQLCQRSRGFMRLAPRGRWDAASIYLGGLVFGPLFFMPLASSGLGGLAEMWGIQLGANLLAVLWVCRQKA
ncbi:MAG: hypothetical protein GYA48_03090 [Chloroflexi bacterium]|nr:hypothetical protein [Chloroflexota bacterium]